MRPAAGRAAVKLARMPTALSRRQLIGLVVLTLMWGLNWPVMKLSLRELARIFHRSRATNEDGIALVCPKIQVSNLDQRAGNAEAKLYRRN